MLWGAVLSYLVAQWSPSLSGNHILLVSGVSEGKERGVRVVPTVHLDAEEREYC